jgi:GMP synthase-like glutamine amidotransferase
MGENVFNFHGNDTDYYEEWFDEVEEQNGWIAMLNVRKHVKEEINDHNLDYYFLMGGELEAVDWRTSTPRQFIKRIEQYVKKRLA